MAVLDEPLCEGETAKSATGDQDVHRLGRVDLNWLVQLHGWNRPSLFDICQIG